VVRGSCSAQGHSRGINMARMHCGLSVGCHGAADGGGPVPACLRHEKFHGVPTGSGTRVRGPTSSCRRLFAAGHRSCFYVYPEFSREDRVRLSLFCSVTMITHAPCCQSPPTPSLDKAVPTSLARQRPVSGSLRLWKCRDSEANVTPAI
jgi:hypothetical protein